MLVVVGIFPLTQQQEVAYIRNVRTTIGRFENMGGGLVIIGKPVEAKIISDGHGSQGFSRLWYFVYLNCSDLL